MKNCIKKHWFKNIVILGIAIIIIFAACISAKEDALSIDPSELPAAPEDALYKDPTASVDDRVKDILSRMTLKEKIGQMTQIESVGALLYHKEDIAKYYLGSLLNGGSSHPMPNTPEEWVKMYDEFQEQAMSTRLGIPLIYGYDAVHGNSKVVGGVIFPHNIGLGATRNPDLVREIGRITALEVAATGVDWTFGPCLAVPQDERWGRTYEGFGEVTDLVSMLAGPIIEGLQGIDLSAPETILATAKHFGGDGGTMLGIDRGDTRLDAEDLMRIHLAPYRVAIESGVGSVMISFNSWNGEKVHGSHYLITDVLKEKFKFEGIVISDWQAIDHLPGNYYSDVVTSINAGLDMVMVPYNYILFTETLFEAVQNKEVKMKRIDDAVSRILRIKFMLGLFEEPYSNPDLLPFIGCDEHREVARDAVRQSLVLLKNNNNILPLPKDLNHIYVCGSHADNLGFQCGGWSLSWQGGGGDITEGTTILEAIQNTVSDNTEVTYSRYGEEIEEADVVVFVIGESPYAEYKGDNDKLELLSIYLKNIKRIKEAGMPVVVILISGRPLMIAEELDNWDALIAAWLPGTEGQGIADVLFGDYNPTGKLPISWPRSIEQVPINYGDIDYNPLFEYGFGLSYTE